jgi:hypothetical protein
MRHPGMERQRRRRASTSNSDGPTSVRLSSNRQPTLFSDHSPVERPFVSNPLLSLRQRLGDQSTPCSLQVTTSAGIAPTDSRTDPSSETIVETLGTWSQLAVPLNLTERSAPRHESEVVRSC